MKIPYVYEVKRLEFGIETQSRSKIKDQLSERMLLADITSDTGWEFQCGEFSKEENVKKTTIWNIVQKETRTPEGTVLIPRQDTQSINVAVSLFVQTFYQ